MPIKYQKSRSIWLHHALLFYCIWCFFDMFCCFVFGLSLHNFLAANAFGTTEELVWCIKHIQNTVQKSNLAPLNWKNINFPNNQKIFGQKTYVDLLLWQKKQLWTWWQLMDYFAKNLSYQTLCVHCAYTMLMSFGCEATALKSSNQLFRSRTSQVVHSRALPADHKSAGFYCFFNKFK